jgi:ribosomal protein S12 methylthiotransferase accessory factor
VARAAYRPGSFRVRPVATELDALVDTYVDSRVGLVRSVDGWSEGALLVAAAPVGLRTGVVESGYGRSTSFRDSRLTALLEALERFGCSPAGRETAVLGSLSELGDDALDPRTLGLYPPERYELPGFGMRPFTEDQPYRWVWGWSFARRRPVLVPAFYAFYGGGWDGSASAGHAFVHETSNGCALGGCLEEAILYGLLEVAERDAFLLTWYARLPAPAIAVGSAVDRTLPMLVAAVRAETGYQVSFFDITVEQGIPSVWALARNLAPGDGRPAVACAAGSHPRPEHAIRNALAELTPTLGYLIRRYAAPGEAERARRMVADPGSVRRMEDHSLLYCDSAAADRLAFLVEDGRARAVAEVGGPGLPDADLRDALLAAVDRYTAHGLDVVAVDQTGPEHLAGGFHCVKVIVPGTLPMTFGHHRRRTDALPRLYEVPRLLGYRDAPLPAGEVNPHPHPFP